MRRQRHVGRVGAGVCLVALLMLLALVAAGPAAAGPAGDTLGLDELRLRLDGGPLAGHLKTTFAGYAVQEVPVTVHALIEDAWGSLILFEATGPDIERIGGIALGMSGSPVYVDDVTGPKLVGAVSYGDQFTLGGMGLATPIEYMEDLQATYTTAPATVAGAYRLEEPAETDQGRVTDVLIAPSLDAGERLEATVGQTVMTPLALVEIGGLRPQSPAYQELAARLERSGLTVRPSAGGGAWDGPPAPPLGAGSPCVAMFSRGTVWFGAAGTVTYVDGDTALLFGHPLWWVGPTEAALHAGYVSGVWPSLLAPYMLTAPRDEKGVVVQDRYWGAVADLGRAADMVPVTTRAVYPDAGLEVVDGSSVSQWLLTQPYYFQAAPFVTMYALTAANDVEYYAGSAETTTRVIVSDGTGSYVMERDNVWDTADDVAMEATWDVYEMLAALADDTDGVLRPHVESIALDAAVTPQRRSARIAGVVLPQGLLLGDNPVVVQYYRYGSAELQEVQGTLTMPKGVTRTGTLEVVPATWAEWDDGWLDVDGDPPQTLAELVDEVNAGPSNGDLTLRFEPEDFDETTTVEARLSTPYVFGNEFWGETASVRVAADRTIVPFGGAVRLTGSVAGVDGEIELDVLRRDAGRDGEILVRTITAWGDGGAARFATRVTDLRRNTRLIVRTHPTSDYLTGNGVVSVRVRAAVSLRAEPLASGARLTVKVRPVAAAGTVLLERYRDGQWVVIRSVPRASGETVTFRVGPGTHVLRARFVRGDICANGVSPTLTVRAY